MEELLAKSAIEMAEAIHCKDIKAVELLEAILSKIEKINPKLNAIVQLDAEQARERAAYLDDLQERGFLLGPLHGVPFTAKDVYNTKGIVTTLGTLGLREHVPDHDAIIIKRLKEAGAILLGKTNVPELCTAAETENLVYGVTNNPYDLERTPGGSSGGEAAIIAAAASPFGVGSDLAGSLRIPAHYCGVATIRPTIGRVACSRDLKGTNSIGIRIGPEALLATDGPMARYVNDLEVILKVISGPDGVDPHAQDIPLLDSHDVSIEQLNIAYFADNLVQTPMPEIIHCISESAQSLVDAGATLEEKPPKFMSNALEVMIQLMTSSFHAQTIEAALLSYGTKQPSTLLTKFLDRVRRESASHHDFSSAWANWDYYRSAATQYMHDYDAIICPVLPFTATTHHQSLWDDDLFPALTYCFGFSLLQYPAATVRVGSDKNGLPIGIQIVAKPWREDVALAIARQLESTLGGWQMPMIAG